MNYSSINDLPITAPPEGLTANFADPPNKNGLTIGMIVLFFILVLFGTVVRSWERVVISRTFQLGDACALLAFGLYVGVTYCWLQAVQKVGFFVHTWNLQISDLTTWSYWFLLLGIEYSLVIPAIKTAILLDWKRILIPHGRGSPDKATQTFWWALTTLLVVQNLMGLVFVILLCVRCVPFPANYDQATAMLHPQYCSFTLYPVQLATGGMNIAFDISMLILPQRRIWTLAMTWQKRLGVSVTFSVGLIACICSIARLVATVNYNSSNDPMYVMGPYIFWCAAEMSCAFLIAAVPYIPTMVRDVGLGPFFKNVLRFGQTSKSLGGMNENTSGVFVMRSRTQSTQSGLPALDHECGNVSTGQAYDKFQDNMPLVDVDLEGGRTPEHLFYDDLETTSVDNEGFPVAKREDAGSVTVQYSPR